MIGGFCTDKAFEKIVNLVEQKRFRQRQRFRENW
nr:unnamed protein product [Callosobruchus analis]